MAKNHKNDTVVLSFRIGKSLYDGIIKLAKKKDAIAPLSGYVRLVLADHVKEEEEKENEKEKE